MTAFNLDDYPLHLGDHNVTMWCLNCADAVYGPDGMYLSFNCDRAALPITTLITAAQTHHDQHHATPDPT